MQTSRGKDHGCKVEWQVVEKLNECFIVNETKYTTRQRNEYASSTSSTNPRFWSPSKRNKVASTRQNGRKNTIIQFPNDNPPSAFTKVGLNNDVKIEICLSRRRQKVQLTAAAATEPPSANYSVEPATTSRRSRKHLNALPTNTHKSARCNLTLEITT